MRRTGYPARRILNTQYQTLLEAATLSCFKILLLIHQASLDVWHAKQPVSKSAAAALCAFINE